VLELLYKPLPFRFFLLTLTNNLHSSPTHPNKTYLKVFYSTKMQLLLIPLLAALVPFAVAQSADIASWSVAGCSSGSQGTTTVQSNSGECYAEDSGQSIMLQSISGGCTMTVYCDSACSTCANVANVGDCRTGVSGFSIDC